MTRSAAASPKVLLVEDRRGSAAARGSAPLRRYRIARRRFDDGSADPHKRFEYLKRSHD